ncbi:MAG: DUF3108 domain-containing protein [Candidatus Cloacimonas sp.]
MRTKLVLFGLFLICLINLSAATVPFMDGEKLTFTIRYGIVNAGEASLQARSYVYQGSPVWHLSTTANTYPFFNKIYKVSDRVESWWDKNTLQPYKFSKNLQEGHYRQYRIHIYNHNALKSTYQRWSFKKSVFDNSEMSIPENTQDILSAFYLVRTNKLEVGKPIFVNITADGRNMPTKILVHRKEYQKTIFGNVECLVIEPKLQGDAIFKQSGRILIWLTNDEYKIPVRLESKITIGSFIATLTSAQQVPFKANQ